MPCKFRKWCKPGKLISVKKLILGSATLLERVNLYANYFKVKILKKYKLWVKKSYKVGKMCFIVKSGDIWLILNDPQV